MARYAKIKNGVVENLVELHFTNADNYPDCVPVEDAPVEIGDAYTGGSFYRDGVRIMSSQEQLAETLAILDVILGGAEA